MKTKQIILLVVGTVAIANAQLPSPPRFQRPYKSSFTELTAYNYPGYTPQQLWSWRNVEHTVKFDTGLNCYYEGWKSNGNEQTYDSYCWSKEVHWKSDGLNQCATGAKIVNVKNTLDKFYANFDAFTKYEGIVDDPYYTSGQKFYRMKHTTQNRWIWYRTSDLALVYEQFYDGTQASYIKLYENGIRENTMLFTSDFRIPKCANPFLSMNAMENLEFNSAFSFAAINATRPIASSNHTSNNTHQPSQFDQNIQAAAKWVLVNYDANKDGQLDEVEAKKLWNDVASYDYAGEVVAEIAPIQQWIAKFDTSKDGKLTLGELCAAIKDNSSTFSLASIPVRPLPVQQVETTEEKLVKVAQMIMSKYDTNKDGSLDPVESERLWNDVASYDYAGEVIAQTVPVQQWIASLDSNKDGKITLGELSTAVNANSAVFSLATTLPAQPIKVPIVPAKPISAPKSAEEVQLEKAAQWVMVNYDTNKDGQLDEVEAKRLFNDVASYDYAGEVVAQLGDIKSQIASVDANKDGKITIRELIGALQTQSGVLSMAAVAPAKNTTAPIKPVHHNKTISEEEKKLQQYAQWVLTNYDANKDGQLDVTEAKKLWNDIAMYDYSGEIIAQVGQVQQWIANFDTNKDGKLVLGELISALNQIQ